MHCFAVSQLSAGAYGFMRGPRDVGKVSAFFAARRL